MKTQFYENGVVIQEHVSMISQQQGVYTTLARPINLRATYWQSVFVSNDSAEDQKETRRYLRVIHAKVNKKTKLAACFICKTLRRQTLPPAASLMSTV